MTLPGVKAPGLRERKKGELRRELHRTALELFRKQGFEATPIDAIAAAAGVSRRTVFRYFTSKEAMVFEGYAERLERFRALAQRLPSDASALAAVRRACLEIAREYQLDRVAVLAQHRLVQSSPALVAHELELDRGWLGSIEQVLTRELPPFEARILAGATFGAIRAALATWFEAKGRVDLVTIGGQAFDVLDAGERPRRRKR